MVRLYFRSMAACSAACEGASVLFPWFLSLDLKWETVLGREMEDEWKMRNTYTLLSRLFFQNSYPHTPLDLPMKVCELRLMSRVAGAGQFNLKQPLFVEKASHWRNAPWTPVISRMHPRNIPWHGPDVTNLTHLPTRRQYTAVNNSRVAVQLLQLPAWQKNVSSNVSHLSRFVPSNSSAAVRQVSSLGDILLSDTQSARPRNVNNTSNNITASATAEGAMKPRRTARAQAHHCGKSLLE